MRSKKHIALFLITAFIGINLLMPPKKAQAFLGIGDIVIDIVQETIKLTLNTAAHTIARQVVSKLVSSTVTWANSGFNGNPVFVQNPTQFLATAANNSALGFINGIGHGRLGFLCSPFQQQIQLSLRLYYYNGNPELDQQGALQCTWTGVTANMQSFLDGKFSDGGWKGWFSMTQEPTNNVYAAGVQAQIDFAGQIAQAAGQTQTDITKSHGFLDIPGDCQIYNPKGSQYEEALNSGTGDPTYKAVTAEHLTTQDVDDGDSGMVIFDPNVAAGECIQHAPSKTPGSVIETQLNNSVAAPLGQLISAKDWDEVVGALVNGLTQRIFNSATGLFTSNPTKGLPTGQEGSNVPYTGPTSSANGTSQTNTTGELACTAGAGLFAQTNTPVTWSVTAGPSGPTDYYWTGDEIQNATSFNSGLGVATGSSITITYQIPTDNGSPKTMSVTASTTVAVNASTTVTKIIGPVTCSKGVIVGTDNKALQQE